MPFAGSSTLEPGLPLMSPYSPYYSQSRDGTPARVSRRKLLMWGIRATLLISNTDDRLTGTLENERGDPFQAGQYRYGGVKKRPVPEIGVGMRHDFGAGGFVRSEDADQASAVA